MAKQLVKKNGTTGRLKAITRGKSVKPSKFAYGSGSIRVRNPRQPKRLSGGNPQIAKGTGDLVVQAYISAMPGWKSDVGRRLDKVITRVVPGVCKGVKWNSPLYGTKANEWFIGVHCFAKYIKVAFFRGALLRPTPPGASKQKDVRYLNIREGDWGAAVSETQVSEWVRQASLLAGVRM